MRVYRVENADGIGPYQSFRDEGYPWWYIPEKQPDPVEDGVFAWVDQAGFTDTNIYEYKFGFESKEQMLSWFSTAALGHFEKRGLHVHEYQVKQEGVRKGSSQIAFKVDHAVRKRKVSVADAITIH